MNYKNTYFQIKFEFNILNNQAFYHSETICGHENHVTRWLFIFCGFSVTEVCNPQEAIFWEAKKHLDLPMLHKCCQKLNSLCSY